MLSLLITTNVKGATLTDAEYARLRLVFSDLRIATMSDEKAQEYLSYDLEHNKTPFSILYIILFDFSLV